ncbi:MAG: hypothetical protein KAI84_06465 [Gammaproteobacteria bacterium]|nr:hypothetical protein [Gammaproteobacteria bacterium]
MSSKNNNLPEWVNWKAQDAGGAWWGYSVEPLEFSNGWYENEIGLRMKLKQSKANPDWKNSLIKIN